jgi:hypothetical protein
MREDKHRYFIELQVDAGKDVSRRQEAELRRAQAEQFVSQISAWLLEEELKDKVTSVAVTALGQVLITCEQDVISRMRGNETLNIVTIRSGATLSESVQRIGGV